LGGLGHSLQVPAQRPERELLTDEVAKPEDICNRAFRVGDPEPLACSWFTSSRPRGNDSAPNTWILVGG